MITYTYSTALNVYDSALELSNYSNSAFTISSLDGSEINMNHSSKLNLSGYSFDTTSNNDDINVYETEISLSQIPEGQDIKVYLGNDNSDSVGSLYNWGFGGEPGIQYRKVTYHDISNNEVYQRKIQ